MLVGKEWLRWVARVWSSREDLDYESDETHTFGWKSKGDMN
jgi:hypothetical protein